MERLDTEQQPRIAPLHPEELSADADRLRQDLRVAAHLPPATGPMPAFLGMVLRHPALYRRSVDLAVELMNHGTLPARDRELAVLRIAWLCQAPYEWGEHVAIGKRLAGLDTCDIERVTHGAHAPGWSEEDRAILRAVDEMFDNACISDKTWVQLASRLDERQLIELPILVGQYLGTAYLQNSLRVPLMPGNAGLGAR